MLHAYIQRFDVTKNLNKFCKILETKRPLSTSTNISTELFVFSDLSRVTHHTRVSRAGHRSGAALLTHT